MAMGKRKARQESLFIATDQLPQSPGHPFYQRLNALLAEAACGPAPPGNPSARSQCSLRYNSCSSGVTPGPD